MRIVTGAQYLFHVFIFTLFACFLAYSINAQNTPPVLTFNAGNGMSAEMSNYQLTNYGQTTSGRYQGTFCFDLANTSQAGVFLGAYGFGRRGGSEEFLLVSQSNTRNFQIDSFQGYLGYLEASFALIAPGYPEDLNGSIAPGNNISSCLTVARILPFTLNDLTGSTLVLFGDESTPLLPITFYSNMGTQSSTSSSVQVTTYIKSNFETCFFVHNSAKRAIIGVAFESLISNGPFLLTSVSPFPRLDDQNLTFTSPVQLFANNGKGREPIATFDFGLITGKSLSDGKASRGIPPGGYSSTYCIAGRVYDDWFFGGPLMQLPTLVFFQGNEVVAFQDYQLYSQTGGVRGTVATVAR